MLKLNIDKQGVKQIYHEQRVEKCFCYGLWRESLKKIVFIFEYSAQCSK